MKRDKIGIIGGASPHAGALLFKAVVEAFSACGEAVPEVLLLNYPFTRGLRIQDAVRNQNLHKAELQYCIDRLARQGVTLASLGCNTLHLCLQGLNTHGIRFISLPNSVMEEAMRRKMKKLLILATETSIQKRLYRHPELEMVLPNSKEQKSIDRILDRVLGAQFDSEDGAALLEIAERIYCDNPYDGLVLGCTDFPVLHEKHPFNLKRVLTLDSVRIAADRLVQNYLGRQHV